DVAVVADDERGDAGDSICGRVCHEREPADHVSPDDVVGGAAGRGRTLCEQRTIQIAVVRGASTALWHRVARRPRLDDERTERARPLAGLRLPVETVPLTLGALEPLGVLEDARTAVPRVVFALRIDIREAYLDRGELVSPDPTKENLVVAGIGVPDPSRAVRHEGNGKRIVVRADIQDDLSAAALE